MSVKPTSKAQAEETAKAVLAKKRENAAMEKEREANARDLPPGGDVVTWGDSMPTPLAPPPSPVNLYKAIHQAQAKIETVRKNGNNPHFKSKYATLDEVWETVKKPLNEAGLIVICDVYKNGEERVLCTRLIHAATGEEVSCAFPIAAAVNSPQAIGSALTYARRYTLTALLEIVTGDGVDDDGEAATNHNASPSAKAAADALGF